MAVANLFKNATVIPAKPAAGKKAKPVTTLIEGLEVYSAIDHITKWLKSTLAVVKTEVQDASIEKFIADGIKAKGKPANFEGSEGASTANIQLRKRSADSGLTDVEKELVAKYNVPTNEVSDRPETYIINPAHLDWINKNAAKVSAAFAKLGAPDGIIQYQEATTKTVTTDDSIDFVFKTYHDKPEIVAALVPVVSTFAVKPKFESTTDADKNNDKALAVLKEYLGAVEVAIGEDD